MVEIPPFIARTINAFKSMRLALILLLILAAASIFGTIIPQLNLDPVQVSQVMEARPVMGPILEKMGMFHVYSTWWYLGLLFLLFLNILTCTIPRSTRTVRDLLKPKTEGTDKFIGNMRNGRVLETDADVASAAAAVQASLGKHRYRVFRKDEDGRILFGAHKGRFGPLGSIFFHFSFIVLLIGVIFGRMTGMKAQVRLNEGQRFEVSAAGFQQLGVVPEQARFFPGYKPFDLYINDFQVKFLDNGQPDTFITTYTVYDGGKKMFTDKLWVNRPLEYNGLFFYQSQYGWTPYLKIVGKGGKLLFDGKLTMSNPDEQGQSQASLESPTRQSVEIFFLPTFMQDEQGGMYSSFPGDRNPACVIRILDVNGNEELSTYVLLGKTVKERGYTISFPKLYQWTGLEVARDSGVNIIWLAFIIGPTGLLIAFYLVHRRIWANVAGEEGRTVIRIGGRADRNRYSFDQEYAAVLKELTTAISARDVSPGRVIQAEEDEEEEADADSSVGNIGEEPSEDGENGGN